MNKHILKFRFAGIAAFLAMLAVFAAVAMLLWNALLPELFGLPALTYWQTAGIVALSRILFGGIGGHGLFGGGRHFARHGRMSEEQFFHHGNPLREKWMKMSEEERREFIEKERNFHGFFHDRFAHLHECWPRGGEPFKESGASKERENTSKEGGVSPEENDE